MPSLELSFPPRCPNCSTLLMDGAHKHCQGRFCHWMRCVCTATIDQAGRFFLPPPRT